MNYCANRVPGGKKRPFMESACTLSSQIAPTFSSSNALTHFSQMSSSATSTYLPHWVQLVMPSSNISVRFDLSPITSAAIKNMLDRCRRNSAPGQDGTICPHITPFILLGSQKCPPAWVSGEITLLHKEGDTSQLLAHCALFSRWEALSQDCSSSNGGILFIE